MTSFDEWRCDRDTKTTWHKSDVQHKRFYAWSERFLKFTKPLYTKWLIAENHARVFNYDIMKDLAKPGAIQHSMCKSYILCRTEQKTPNIWYNTVIANQRY